MLITIQAHIYKSSKFLISWTVERKFEVHIYKKKTGMHSPLQYIYDFK